MKESQSLRQLGALVSQQISPRDVPSEAWQEIIYVALQQGLAPLLLWVAKQSAPDIVAEPLWTPAIMSTRGAVVRYMALETSRKQIGAALEAAQIPSLWIKGIALANTIYSEPYLRPMGDLDVLVPYDQREGALQVVEALGYHFYETNGQLLSSKEALDLNLTHHYRLMGGINDSVVLELHFRLLSSDDELLPLGQLAWFWTQTTCPQNSPQFTVLQTEAHLLYLCAHAILQHGEDSTLLRQYFDLHQLITSMPVNWEEVVEQAVMLGWVYAIERALSLVVRFFSTPIPDNVFADLRKSRNSHDEITARAVRIRGKGSRWEMALMSLHRLSPGEQVGLVRRILFPPKSYMRVRYGLGPDEPVWPSYLYRWLDQSWEVAWAIWNRLTGALRGREQ